MEIESNSEERRNIKILALTNSMFTSLSFLRYLDYGLEISFVCTIGIIMHSYNLIVEILCK
jgi:hypothetical protein